MDNNYYFKPYEGEEPFVFISYAHADSSQVMPIIADMNKCGFRVWYDEGIEAGSMWTECIADHLTRASLVLGFISNSYMASENCKREMNFAVQKRKKLINIFLSPTELTPGMDLQIGGIWALMKYTFPNDNHFFMKLYEAPLLYSEDFGVAKPEELKIAEADDKKAGEANSYRAQIINEEKEKGSILEKSKSGVQKEKRKKSKKTLIIVLSILLLLVAGSVGFWITGRATGVTGRLYNRFLRIEFPIKTLAPETEAKFKNPIIEKAVRDFIKKPEGKLLVSDLSNVTELYIRGEQASMTSRFDAITANPSSFEAEAKDSAGDAQTIKRGSISDLGDIKYLPNLKTLQLSFQSINSLESLPQCKILDLDISNNRLKSLDGIGKIQGLIELNADNNQIIEIGNLAECYKLKTLLLLNSEPAKLTDLKTLPFLSKLRVSKCNLATLKPILLPGKLIVAEFYDCDLRGDIFDIMDGKALRELRFENCIFNTLKDIERTHATDMWFIKCKGIDDWSPLLSSTTLATLHVDKSIEKYFTGKQRFKLVVEQ